MREFNVLDAQQFAFNSVEIAFRPTTREIKDNPGGQEKVEELFAAGLRWVQQLSPAPASDLADVNRAVLEAIKSLSPGRGSLAMKVEVSGRVAERATGSPSARVVLTRRTRRRAQAEIRRLVEAKPEPEYLTVVGRVKEADAEALTFELRNRTDKPGAGDVIFAFQPDDIDDVTDALRAGYLVRVGGSREPGATTYQIVFFEPLNSAIEASEDDGSSSFNDSGDDDTQS